MNLKPIDKSIYFTFLQDVTAGSFDNKTNWGFEMKNPTKDLDKARWAVVQSVGSTVTDVVVGDYILVQPLMWTTKVEGNGGNIWKTSEEHLMGKSKDRPTDLI